MPLSKALVKKFQQAHLEEFGEPISAKLAEAELLGLAEIIEITGRIHLPNSNKPKDGDENGSE